MDDAKNFLASVLGTVRDRLGNPLISAFAVAWCIWNFRVILVLVGKGEGGWLAKINYLDKTLMVPSWMWALHGFLIPLCVALVWIFCLPSLLRKVSIFHERQGNQTRGALLSVLEATPISEADRTQLWSTLMKERKTWSDEREELYKVVAELQAPSSTKSADVAPAAARVTESLAPNATLTGGTLETPAPESGAGKVKDAGFFHKTTEERALLLGLPLKKGANGKSTEYTGLVSLDGYELLWPWLIPARTALYGLSVLVARNVEEKLFSEFDLWVLHACKNGERQPFNPTSNAYEADLSFDIRASVDLLLEANLLQAMSSTYEINSQGRLFLAWLYRVGFKFKPVSR